MQVVHAIVAQEAGFVAGRQRSTATTVGCTTRRTSSCDSENSPACHSPKNSAVQVAAASAAANTANAAGVQQKLAQDADDRKQKEMMVDAGKAAYAVAKYIPRIGK